MAITRLDRLTRRARDLLHLVEDVFLAKHVELHSVTESLDTSTPQGRLVLTLLGGLAQMEREQIAERTREVFQHKRELGQPTGPAPLGFRSNGKRNRMIPIPEELDVVRRILRLWRRGKGYRAIAAGLNRSGVPTRRGGEWRHSTIKRVVERREFYEKAFKEL